MKRSDTILSAPRVDLEKLRALDVIVIVAIVLGSAGWLWASKFDGKASASTARQVSVYHDGVLAEKLRLDTDREISLLKGKILLEIRADRIRVKSSHCPRQFCVHQGWARYEGESIVCVPFKTLIEIASTARPQVDAVVY